MNSETDTHTHTLTAITHLTRCSLVKMSQQLHSEHTFFFFFFARTVINAFQGLHSVICCSLYLASFSDLDTYVFSRLSLKTFDRNFQM